MIINFHAPDSGKKFKEYDKFMLMLKRRMTDGEEQDDRLRLEI